VKRLFALGLALEGVYVAIALQPEGKDGVFATLVLHFGAALLYLAAGAIVMTLSHRTARPRRDRDAYLLVLALSALFRGTALLEPPLLSTDIHRYVWEGRVQAHLENPYRLPPDAKELAPLRDATWEKVEHKEIPAIYGPIAEASFLALRAPLAMKAFFALADLAVLGLVARALARRGLPAPLAIFYGWHPLAVIEVAGQGHMDALGVALLLLALDLAERKRPALAGAALGLGAAVKYLPLIILPAFVRRAGARSSLLAITVFAACFLPYGLPRGLEKYATEWRFNATGILLVEEALDRTHVERRAALVLAGGDGRKAVDTPFDKAPQRIAAALLVALVALALSRAELEKAALGSIAAVLALSPVVHPWYFLWVLPFAVTRRSLALIELALAAPVSYSVLLAYDGSRESWHEEAWPRLLLLVPFLGLLVWENAPYGKRVPGAP
jgi:hypothetical protein